MGINHKRRWQTLQEKANAADCSGPKGFMLPFLAMQSAGENACDTGFTYPQKEWFVCAYASIASTSWFCENESCRAWFKRNGYEW